MPWDVLCRETFYAVGRLEMGHFKSRHSVLWDVYCRGTFSDGTFVDGTFLQRDVSRAGPFVCAPFEMVQPGSGDHLERISMWSPLLI